MINKLNLIVMMLLLTACNGNLKRDVHDLQARIDDQQGTIAALQQQQLSTIAALNSVVAAQASMLVAISALQSQGGNIQSQVSVLQAQVVALQGQESAMQNVLNTQTAQLALLMGYKSIVDFVNPCGDTAGLVDEVLLRLSDGTILASYSDTYHGDNTRFAVVPTGAYVTTDGSNCHFSVQANGSISW